MNKVITMSQALRSLFLLLLFLLLQQQYGHAQYGNEWINHSRTYWKFNTGTDGIFRISKESLDAAGVPSTAAGTDYILYRNGKEVTLYTTTDLAFATGDYIEFYAFAADGYADKELYLDTATQADEEASLFSDTAAYFLTVDHSSSHARYTRISTAIPPVPPPAPAYNWQTLSYHGRGYYLAGKTSQKRNNFYSSQFDPAEGFIDALHNARDVVSKTIPTPNRVSTAPVNALLRLNSLAYNYYDSLHHLKVSFNGKVVADSTYGAGDIRKFYLQIPAASLTASNTLSAAHYSTAPSPDVSGWAYWSLEYPANFTATGLDYLSFKLEASASPQYLEFSGFNHGGTAPKLYDLTNNKWYSGDISVSGKTKFYVDASLTQSKMLLYAGASTRIYNLNTARQVNFIDYSNAAQQGNYIIISHRNFSGANGGKNYIGGYKNYRSSAAGGSYKVVSVDVEDLYDQFAWGISTHPSSIRHFLDYAYDKWSTRPTNVFLIGKPMLLNVYRTYLAYSGDYEYEGTVPAYGNPGSDIDFVNDRHTWKMKMAISRLSAWKGTEVADYLEKVKAYEASLAPAAFPTPATELWKKEVLHIAGGDGTTPDLQASILLPTLNQCRDIISSKPLAAHVTTVAKSTKGLPTTIEDKTVDSLISNGVSMITYYGHGSAYTLDYNMKDPSEYHSLPRIPFFSAFGCAISDIFELAKTRTASEEWIMAPNSGAIVSLAPSNLGFTSFHSLYMPSLYKILTGTYTGRTIGDIYRACNDSLAQFAPPDNSSSNLTHLECYILQGDPAVHIPQPSAKPDFYTDNKLISNIPVAVSTAMDSFKLKIVCYNLGKVNGDTLRIKIEHRNPAGASTVSGYILARNLLYSDTVDLNIPVNKTKDVGLNKYIVTLDPDNVYDETSEANNTGSLDIFIYSDNLVPVYPENYGIVYKPELTLKASTLNVFRGNGAYLFELDTTELFNSSAKMQTRLSGKGGVIGWKPALMMTDSTVYYWRCTIDTLVNGAYNWAYSSFIYLKNGTAGWNQSHYYQYLHNTLDSLDYNTDRKFSYQQSASAIRVINGVLELPAPYAFYQNSPYCKVFQDGADLQLFDCQYTGNLQIMVFDSVTGKTWENPPGGRQGALAPCAVNRNQFCFSFPLSTAASRNKAMKFLDSIPNGYYIVLKNCIYHPQWSKAYVSTWMNDTLANGSGISLYHSMRRLGFNQIDSFYREIPFAMICKKGSASYPVQQHYGTVADELQDVTFSFPVLEERGRMNSVVIGPALAWKSLKWRTSNKTDTANNADSAAVKITGIDAAAHETELYAGAARDVNMNLSVPPLIRN